MCQCYDHLFPFLILHSLGTASLGALEDHGVIPSNGAANEVKQEGGGGGRRLEWEWMGGRSHTK